MQGRRSGGGGGSIVTTDDKGWVGGGWAKLPLIYASDLYQYVRASRCRMPLSVAFSRC